MRDRHLLHHVRAYPPDEPAPRCTYWWEITIFPGSAPPTSGSSVFEDVTIDGVTADITIDFDETGATLVTHLLTQFSSLESGDIEATGSLPGVPIDLKFNRRDREPSWPVTEGASTLNNGAQCQIRQRNPR